MILNDYFNEPEGYKIPTLLLETLLGPDREKLLSYLDEKTPDKYIDTLRDDYQNEHGDRDKLKQDFTPDGIVKIIRGIVGDGQCFADICAGTGAITIANMKDRKKLYCLCRGIFRKDNSFFISQFSTTKRRWNYS